MPLTGYCAWKAADISTGERIDRFFNLIDHAVENGVPLADLYSREHVKTFVFYVLKHATDNYTCNPRTNLKDLLMLKLTLTSTFASSIIVGDPGVLVINLPAKATRTVDINDVQLRQLTAQLEKLKAAKWLDYTVTLSTELPAIAAPIKAPPAAPAKKEATRPTPPPVKVTPAPVAEPVAVVAPVVAEPVAVVAPVVAEAPAAVVVEEPVAVVAPVAVEEPVAVVAPVAVEEPVVVVAPVVVDDVATAAEPIIETPKLSSYDKKNRNR